MSDTPPNAIGSLFQSLVTLLIRHAISAASGVLLAHGLIAQTDATKMLDAAGAAAVWLVPVIWSFINKTVLHKAVSDAAAK